MASDGLISVVYTCMQRPELTELTLRRFRELMKYPCKLTVCYDGWDMVYRDMIVESGKPDCIINNPYRTFPRWMMVNDALETFDTEYYMHLENDFYWQDPRCLDAGIEALERFPELDYVRFELLPFRKEQFNRFEKAGDRDICFMKPDTPFRFTWNPHIRRMKYPCGEPVMERGFTKQPEQHHNDCYEGLSACMTGENFRHIGLYDSAGHDKTQYAERFTLRRGEKEISNPLEEFTGFCNNEEYVELFRRYLDGNNRD